MLVVVHDAGGAEIMGAFIKREVRGADVACYGNGPALRVFKRLRIPIRKLSDSRDDIARVMSRQPRGTVLLASAPGWMSKLEIRALEEAKRHGLFTTVYMDSWMDERKRFGFPKLGWEKRLPDEFWVADQYAFERVKNSFPGRCTRLVPNLYHANIVRRYRDARRKAIKPRKILFVSQASYRGTGAGNAKLLREIVHSLSKRKESNSVVRIRLHPADKSTRYDALISEYKGRVHIEESSEKDIVNDLLQARMVVGTETDVLVLATLCKIRAISYVKAGMKPITPHSSIERIADVRQIRSVL